MLWVVPDAVRCSAVLHVLGAMLGLHCLGFMFGCLLCEAPADMLLDIGSEENREIVQVQHNEDWYAQHPRSTRKDSMQPPFRFSAGGV